VEAVREVEEERDRDDGDERELHVGPVPALGVLDDDVPDHVCRALGRVEGVLERVVDVFPADDHERVDPLIAEELGDRVADDPVALVLELLQPDEVRLDALDVPQPAEGGVEPLDGGDDDPALLERRPGDLVDPVELEQVGRLLDQVDNVVERGRS
jgi:hypothetical protein